MLELEMTLWNGTHERVEFTNEKINSGMGAVINWHDITKEVHPDDVNGWFVKKTRYIHVRMHELTNCTIDFEDFTGVEYIEFKGGVNELNKLFLPPHKYQVVNVPTNLNLIFCSSYAYITNMDELLETDMELNMTRPMDDDRG